MALFLRESALCLISWFEEDHRFSCASALLIEPQLSTTLNHLVVTEEEVHIIHAHIPRQSSHAERNVLIRIDWVIAEPYTSNTSRFSRAGCDAARSQLLHSFLPHCSPALRVKLGLTIDHEFVVEAASRFNELALLVEA